MTRWRDLEHKSSPEKREAIRREAHEEAARILAKLREEENAPSSSKQEHEAA